MCFRLGLRIRSVNMNASYQIFVPDGFSEESDAEGVGRAETETFEVRTEPPGLPEQRA